jgi:hypothetical protein
MAKDLRSGSALTIAEALAAIGRAAEKMSSAEKASIRRELRNSLAKDRIKERLYSPAQ